MVCSWVVRPQTSRRRPSTKLGQVRLCQTASRAHSMRSVDEKRRVCCAERTRTSPLGALDIAPSPATAATGGDLGFNAREPEPRNCHRGRMTTSALEMCRATEASGSESWSREPTRLSARTRKRLLVVHPTDCHSRTLPGVAVVQVFRLIRSCLTVARRIRAKAFFSWRRS